ncbi:hypothetical protein IGI04_015846 [Brassica rapa subsp. trilocularis]|nr:hypothetical protein IGI04_015846 [Brassica rapa subsp. trilocularis]
MDGHADIPPSHSGLSQYPRANPFGDESSNRATMPPPSGSSLPPFPPTGQPFQFGSQNFIPAGSSPSQWMLSQVPHTMLESSSVGSGSSQPASVFSGLFNADQLSKIAASDELKEMAESDPKHLKITLSNRESAARSKAKKALHESELEDKVETLETQIDILTAELKLEKVITILLVTRGRMTADDECVQFRIRLHAGEAHARLREDLIQQLNGEVRRLIEEASVQREEMSRLREEVSEYRRRESERMNANMLDQLNINQQFQEKPQQTNYNFE